MPLDRIVLDDQAPGPGEVPRLRAGLDALAGWAYAASTSILL